MGAADALRVELTGKVAVVTGSARGIGRRIAETFMKCGANVAMLDVNAELLEQTVSQLNGDTAFTANGGLAAGFVCNVTDATSIATTVDAIVKQWGGVQILVNNAGITRDNLVMRMTDEQWDAVLNINLSGTFRFTRAICRTMMKGRWGRIVNMASVVGQVGNPGQCNYSASKGGVIAMTRTIAGELAGRNITVNAIAPGFVATDMTAVLPENVKTEISKRIPLSRMGTPDDIAAAVLFLVSDAAEYITGQILAVDGGLTATMS